MMNALTVLLVIFFVLFIVNYNQHTQMTPHKRVCIETSSNGMLGGLSDITCERWEYR